MKEIQYGYIITKNGHNETKAHNIHFLLNPVTKAICISCDKESELLQHIRLDRSVTVSVYNPKLGRYTRMQGSASISDQNLCDFEKSAYKTLNPQGKKTEALVYVEMNHIEVIHNNHHVLNNQHQVNRPAI
ncbi:MAG: hypothetical protein KDD37_06415 [Bdellovibrionales bacterium]|nr:hypothetical protein [Bdellovibrionales bacterium]